jgi:hypothetical protein
MGQMMPFKKITAIDQIQKIRIWQDMQNSKNLKALTQVLISCPFNSPVNLMMDSTTGFNTREWGLKASACYSFGFNCYSSRKRKDTIQYLEYVIKK